jgi:putative sigma-54 modulation protein
MQIIVRGHKLKITPAIRAYAHKKLQRLERFFSNIQKIVVELEVQKIRNKAQRQTANVTVDLAQGIIRANEADPDIYTAIDKVFDKLDLQIKKHHEKLKTRRQGMGWRFQRRGAPVRNKTPQLVIKASNPIKPMDPQEAVLEYKLNKSDFFVFKNPRNNTLNVLQALENGNYGLYHTQSSEKKGFWGRLFSRREDPTCGEKSITSTIALGRISRMSPETAADFIQRKGWRYYFFLNEDTNRTSLLYALPQGKYGLIESHF